LPKPYDLAIATDSQLAVFDVLANKTARAVLEICWERRGDREPWERDIVRQLGPACKPAIRRLSDLQLLDVRWRFRVPRRHLWNVVQAARCLPAGILIFKILRHRGRCELVEQLIAGPVARDRLGGIRATDFASKTIKDLRYQQLIRSPENAPVVRLEHREQLLWIFVLVDQLLMDTAVEALRRQRNARTRHLLNSGWVRPGDPRTRDYVPARARHPALTEPEDDLDDDPPGEYEERIEDLLLVRAWRPDEVRAVRLVGDYPATTIEVDVVDDRDGYLRTHRAPLWSAAFGLAAGALRQPPPEVIASRARAWMYRVAWETSAETGGA